MDTTASGTTEGQTSGKQTASDPFELRVSEDKMVVLLTSSLPSDRYGEIEQTLIPELKRIGVLEECARNQAVENLREGITNGAALTDFVVLEGAPPVLAEDGKIDWARDFFKKGFTVDPETGTIDYRERLAEDTVQKGDHLADIYPPKPGTDGVTVFGKRVSAGKGQPAKFKQGTGVRVRGGKCYAKTDGRIRFTNGMLSVDHVFTVEGSVGLETGHIKHPGALAVKHNIEAESKIETTGSIEVGGYVEDAEIKTGGDLIVNGGIIGGQGRKLIVEGDVHAKFLKNVHIEAGGDIVSVNGIEQCTVMTRGAVQVPQGRIVGGEVVALMGIDAGDIGSEAGVSTQVTTGQDFALRRRLEALRAESARMESNLQRVRSAIAPHRGRERALDPEAKEKYDLLARQINQIQSRISEIEEELETMPDDSKKRAKQEITVRKQLYPGTTATIGLLSKKVNESIGGPLSIVIRRGDVRFIGRS